MLCPHPGSTLPGWPAGSCGCETGSMSVQADPKPPLPAIPPRSTVQRTQSPAYIPGKMCEDSHAEGRRQNMFHEAQL